MGDKQVIINQLLDTQNKIIDAIKDNRKEIKEEIKALRKDVTGMDIKIEQNANNIKWATKIGYYITAGIFSAIGTLFAKVFKIF